MRRGRAAMKIKPSLSRDALLCLLVAGIAAFSLMQLEAADILLAAVKNKLPEIIAFAEIFLCIFLLISVCVYVAERLGNSSDFTNFFTGPVWSISKLIDGIGGYGNFRIATPVGKLMATVLGFAKIALFAIPAGVFASGFLEEMERVQKEAIIRDNRAALISAFQFEDLTRHRIAKQKYNLSGPKKFLAMEDVNIRLYISYDEMIDVVKNGASLRLTNYENDSGSIIVMEYYEQNAVYGTFNNRNSPVTVISTHSGDQPFMGHYTARLAEGLGANYISNEIYSDSSLREEFRLPILHRDSYESETKDESPVIEQFKADLASVVKPGSLVVYLLAAPPIDENYPELVFVRDGSPEEEAASGAFGDTEKLQAWAAALKKTAEEREISLAPRSDSGSLEEENLTKYLHQRLKADAVGVQISIDLLETSDADLYYGSIRMLADALAELGGVAKRGGVAKLDGVVEPGGAKKTD